MKDVSIIILNYFGERSISNTLDSLINQDYPRNRFEVVVADNNSTDNSRQIIDRYVSLHPSLVRTCYFDFNHGFAKGNNLAIKTCTSKYIALLNNDCIVDSSWLKNLVSAIEADSQIFSVGSKIRLYPPDKNVVQNAGSMVFDDGYGRDIGAVVTQDHNQSYEQDNGQYEFIKEVYSTCGAAVLYRRNILNKIGLLDESFFMYYEDTEISERARLCGYKNIFCGPAVAYHNHAQSSKEWSPFFLFHTEKGRLQHVFYHFPLFIFFREYMKFLIKSSLRFLRSVVKNKDVNKSWQYLRVSFFFVQNINSLLKKRGSLSRLYDPQNRKASYQQLLSGYWYFN